MNHLREYLCYGSVGLFLYALIMTRASAQTFYTLLLTVSTYLLWKDEEEISYMKLLIKGLRDDMQKQ